MSTRVGQCRHMLKNDDILLLNEFLHHLKVQLGYNATDLTIIAFDSKFYALKQGTIKNVIVDKDKPSSIKIKNLHETGQIVSYRPDNHRFRLEMLCPET